jgi:DNA polymerase-3 subunit epsilon
VGKAINIKKRVLSHFYDKSTKEIKMCQETADIDFELAGSELVALLMESDAIKHHYPPFNRAQKRTIQQYAIFSYEDRNGIMHLGHNKLKAAPNPIQMYYSATDCRAALEEICKTYELCPKYCHLQEGVEQCSHYSITNCSGICRGKEDAESYNGKVQKAIAGLKDKIQNFVVQEKGRTIEEQAFIWIENGRYAGYGFVQKEETIHSYEDLDTFLIRKKNTHETQRIVQSYLLKNPEKEKFLLTDPIL